MSRPTAKAKASSTTCPNPSCTNPAIEDVDDGKRICVSCGALVSDNSIVSEITFGESSSGAAVVQGSYVGADQQHARSSGPFRKQGSQEGREMVISSGRRKLNQLASALNIHERFVDTGARFFTLAVTHNFIQGRRTTHVVAVCLYLACRQDKSAHMLIDFSDVLQINVFALGATYLKLVKVLHLSIPQLDPELCVRRFAKSLEFGEKTQQVCKDAIRIVQRMDRDWIMEGRRPSGVCGAAILIAARMNNFRRTVTEIVYVVKVATMTVNKRLEEFKTTKSSELTVEEFRNIWLEKFHDPPSYGAEAKKRKRKVKEVDDNGNVVDEDRDRRLPGMLSSGSQRRRIDADGFAVPDLPGFMGMMDGNLIPYRQSTPTNSEWSFDGTPGPRSPSPTAFETNASEGLSAAAAQALAEEELDAAMAEKDAENNNLELPEIFDIEIEKEILDLIDSPDVLDAVKELRRSRLAHVAALPTSKVSTDESSLSDVDDDEIESCILSENEIAIKTKIWYEYNKEYILNQEAKRLKLEADERNGTGKKPGKRRGKHKPRDSSFPDMAASPAESAKAMLKKKTFSRKINYAALDSLFESTPGEGKKTP